MLEWKHHETANQFYAESNAAPYGTFRIAYDDVMYWPSWSPDCTQDIDRLKAEAQQMHDEKNHVQTP